MRRFVVGTALTWLLVAGPGYRLLAAAASGQGSHDGARHTGVFALEVAAGGLSADRLASKPTPEQDPHTLAVLGGRVQPKPALLSTSADPGGDGVRALLLRLPRPQRGPPSPFA
jgi:hypothetical protein